MNIRASRTSGALSVSLSCLAASAWGQAIPALQTRNASLAGGCVQVTHVPGDRSRILVVLQSGEVRSLSLPGMVLDPSPFLVVPNVAAGGESGLLSLAFHPNYEHNGQLYVCLNKTGVSTETPAVQRFLRDPNDPNVADPASMQPVLTIGMGNGIHNGGWIGFDPDGLLFISTGDGGSSSRARDLTENLRGKILRIDVDGDDFPDDANRNYRIPPGNPYVGIEGDDEIYAFGVRNPWRCSIDHETRRMFIGDVGTSREELNMLPIDQSGLDFGWPCQEGANSNCPAGTTVTPPIAHYRSPAAPPLNIVGNAVIGGEVYRGCGITALDGRYFFGDLSGDIVSFVPENIAGTVINHTPTFSGNSVYGWGRDADGELYFTNFSTVRRIEPTVFLGPDCNGNAAVDSCDIARGDLTDADGDGIPDECASIADIDSSGTVGLEDLSALISAFGTCGGTSAYLARADFNSDGCVNLSDLSVLLIRFGS